MGSERAQKKILDQVERGFRYIQDQRGQPIDPMYLFELMIANVVSTMVYGHGMEFTDRRFENLIHNFKRHIELESENALVQWFPCLRLIPFTPFRRRFTQHQQYYRALEAVTKKEIAEHRARGNSEEA